METRATSEKEIGVSNSVGNDCLGCVALHGDMDRCAMIKAEYGYKAPKAKPEKRYAKSYEQGYAAGKEIATSQDYQTLAEWQKRFVPSDAFDRGAADAIAAELDKICGSFENAAIVKLQRDV